MTSNYEEQQYLDLVSEIVRISKPRTTRNNAITQAVFGKRMEFSLENEVLPLLTTKRVFFRGIVEELLWMLRGCTDAGKLQEKNIRIWDGHSSREHLDSVGLGHYREGDTGPLYGFQWRHQGAEYSSCDADYIDRGVDQIANVIESLRDDPHGRRHIVNAWIPNDLHKMALSPCHVMFQFFVEDDGKLSCMLFQRSGDIGLGVPFNIASYALLTKLIAAAVGRKAKKFIHILGDVHAYENHVEPLKHQLNLQPFPFPKVTIDLPSDLAQMSTQEVLTAFETLSFDHFHLHDYQCHKSIKMDMVV